MSQDPCRIMLVDGLPFSITMAVTIVSGKMPYPCLRIRVGEKTKGLLRERVMGFILVLDLWKRRILHPVLQV